MTLILRPSQTSILRYRGGKMGISAVPGAGKTFTLSALAAQIITSGALAYRDYLPDEAALEAFHSAISTHAPAYGISLHAAVFGEGSYHVCFTAGDQSGALLFAMHLDRNVCDHLQPRLLGWGDAVEVRRLDRLDDEAAKREAIDRIERLALEVEERRLERAWFSRAS